MKRVLLQIGAMGISVLSIIALFVIITFPNRYIFFFAIALWWLLLFIANAYTHTKRDYRILQFATSFSFIVLISLLEQMWMARCMIVLCGIIFFIVWQFSIVFRDGVHSVPFKSARRIIMMLWTFNLYTWYTSVYALSMFFGTMPFWIVGLVGGVLGGLVGYMVWNLYQPASFRSWLVWISIMSLIMIELLWSLKTLPFGYFVLGFLITWVWYLIQLCIRFHVSPQGIMWKRQRWFLLINACMFVLIVSIARWI